MSEHSPASDGIQARLRLSRGTFTLDCELALPGKGVSVIYGHSGSGKSSLLRCLAGLEPEAHGQLWVAGVCWQDDTAGIFLAPHQRPVGCVFQEANLFPHLSVQQNLNYGRTRRPGVDERRAGALVELLGIGPLLTRSTDSLSGGERQRVAIARALFSNPRLLLMDEPLASLDLPRKREILPYLERLHQELSMPLVYVTHAPEELVRLADHLVLLENGHVLAAGPLETCLVTPTLPTATHRDLGCVLKTRVLSYDADYGLLEVAFSAGKLHLPHTPAPFGSVLRLQVKPRDVSLSLRLPEHSSVLNQIPCSVVDFRQDGPAHTLVRLDAAGTPLLASITRLSHDRLKLTPGMRVHAQVKATALGD
jgi:molybdate transport system ATP-binding protein